MVKNIKKVDQLWQRFLLAQISTSVVVEHPRFSWFEVNGIKTVYVNTPYIHIYVYFNIYMCLKRCIFSGCCVCDLAT